ncbi:MAG: dihydrofolate reductase family protein [Bdellovibrio sp.]
MPKLRVHAFSISVDGYGAGPYQDLQNPLGIGGNNLHHWYVGTRTFKKMLGNGEGIQDIKVIDNIDEQYAARGIENIGAWILGRNMFGPIRGPWQNEEWKGWWGDNPPYHTDVFVLTHYPHPPIKMEGGTTFYFVTDGIESALKQAKNSAQGKDVRLGGGVSLIRQYLAAGLVDEMHIAIAPIILGSGEHLLFGLNLKALGYEITEHKATASATHIVFKKKSS